MINDKFINSNLQSISHQKVIVLRCKIYQYLILQIKTEIKFK